MNTRSSSAARFGNIDTVVADPLRFKARLEIGGNAYQSLVVRNNLTALWDVAGVAVTGAQVAGSATVASTFFTTTTGSILGFFGTVSAATPIGWIIAAGVLSGGAYMGVTRFLKGLSEDRVEVIPKFINTPLDVLAIGFFDLVAPLGLKVAGADGKILAEELDVLRSYFHDDWGYDLKFVDAALDLMVEEIDGHSIKELTEGLRKFTLESKDCNQKKVREKVIHLLREIAEADGTIHEMEELAIQHVADFLPKDPWFTMPSLPKLPSIGDMPSLPEFLSFSKRKE